MTNDGYIQIKLREQNEKIISLENEVKTMKTELLLSKQQFEQATKLMQDATDITKFKIDMILAMRKEAQDAVKTQQLALLKSNNKSFDLILEESLKCISEKARTANWLYAGYFASLFKLLEEKKILDLKEIDSIFDLRKDFEDYRSRIFQDATNKARKEMKNNETKERCSN